MRQINNTVVERGYKNTSASETVNINKVSKPFKVISGCIVDMYDNDSNATPSQVKTLKAYQAIFTKDAKYAFTSMGGINVDNGTHIYLVGRGGGVTCQYIKVMGVWKFIG